MAENADHHQHKFTSTGRQVLKTEWLTIEKPH